MSPIVRSPSVLSLLRMRFRNCFDVNGARADENK
jgi:hypothetical protein